MDRHHLLHRPRRSLSKVPRDLSQACSSTRHGSAGRRTVSGRQSLSHCVRHSRSVSLRSSRLGGTGRFITCSRQVALRGSKRTRLHCPVPYRRGLAHRVAGAPTTCGFGRERTGSARWGFQSVGSHTEGSKDHIGNGGYTRNVSKNAGGSRDEDGNIDRDRRTKTAVTTAETGRSMSACTRKGSGVGVEGTA